MPYRDPEKQRAAMREIIRRHRERQKTKEQAKDARLKELEELAQKQTQLIEDAFKPKMSTILDSRDETIIDLQGKLNAKERENAFLRQLLHDEKDRQILQKALPIMVSQARKVNADE
jgi:hypothetical protein